MEMASTFVSEYITKQQANYLSRAVNLAPGQKSAMNGFFREDLLDSVRNLPDFAQMAAVTFNQVVVSHQPITSALLFHELIHVEQYRQLGGVKNFADLYVSGFLAGGGYDSIPLEINAYSLGSRFESDPGVPFSVESEVASFLSSSRN